jgi:signal transduction histidine kinase
VQALSHDFRTLLATIETSRYLIERRLPDEERTKIQNKLTTIQDSVAHLAEQIENLHMVAAIDDLYRTPADLNWLVETLVSNFQSKAQEKDIRLHFEAEPRLPRMAIDQNKIEGALKHLVMNALAYTVKGGSISVHTLLEGENAVVEVRDTGSGMEQDLLDHIFEPFYRGDSARPVGRGGIGLGLTIVKMIVEAHGGSISVDSRPGEGSIFRVVLPLSAEATPLEPLPA